MAFRRGQSETLGTSKQIFPLSMEGSTSVTCLNFLWLKHSVFCHGDSDRGLIRFRREPLQYTHDPTNHETAVPPTKKSIIRM